MSKKTFTVFSQQADQLGTIHIGFVQAADLESAIQAGLGQCLADWNGDTSGTNAPFTPEDIHCLGVAQGNVRVLHWNDQTE